MDPRTEPQATHAVHRRPPGLVRLCLALLLALPHLAVVSTTGATTVERASARPADPSQPIRLSAEVDYATLRVEGYDGDEVTAVARREEAPAARREEGLRVIDALGLELHADGNHVILLLAGDDGPMEVTVRVPRRTDLDLRSSNGGAIHVREVDGELVVVTSNAGIELERVAGSVLAGTSNGAIRATFTSVDADRPMSFVSSNGEIDLTFPTDLAAELYVETDGAFLTDFELEPLERGAGRRAAPPGSRFVHATTGGGGPRIRIRTDNGRVVLRRSP